MQNQNPSPPPDSPPRISETCWHCHITTQQTGKRGWNKCDVCGVMLELGDVPEIRAAHAL